MKLLQGALLRKMREAKLNLPSSGESSCMHRSVEQVTKIHTHRTNINGHARHSCVRRNAGPSMG